MPSIFEKVTDGMKTALDSLDSTEKIVAYGERLFFGMDKETVYVLFLDSRSCFVDCARLAGGSSSGAEVNLRSIVKSTSIQRSAEAVILHNHPCGSWEVSTADRDFTARAAELFFMLDVEVTRHIVITKERYAEVAENNEANMQSLLYR